MNENNNDDIQVVKVKKKKNTNIDSLAMNDKKRNGIDSVTKLTQRNSVINEIGNINVTNSLRASKRPKNKKSNCNQKNSSSNSLESLKATLEDISEMVIKQEADILEAVTGCQEPNNYQAYGKLPNGDKIFVFKCREFSSCGGRYFCPVSCRDFTMRIKLSFEENKNENEEDEVYEKRIIDINKDCKCPFLCCVRPDMKVILAENNNILGRIELKFSCCDPVFSIYDQNNKEIFYIEADCCQCGLMCRNNFMGKTDEAHFFIYKNEDRTNPAGDICKKAAKSMFSIADNYSVVFPQKAKSEEKILLTMAGIMIDYQYFENNTGSK